MKYILTEKELDSLGPKSEIEAWKKAAQILATKVANEVVIGKNSKRVYGCIITKHPDNDFGYCGDCPAHDQCPYEHKEYGK